MALRVHKNGNGNGNGARPWWKVALLAVAVLLAGWLVFRQVDRLRGPKRMVWVAAGDLGQGTLVASNDLEQVVVRGDDADDTALEVEQIEGRQLRRDKAEGETFRSDDFAAPPPRPEVSLAELLPPGRVLSIVDVDVQDVIMSELNFGDRFEILASAGRGDARTRVVASDAYFVAWIDPSLLAGNATQQEQPSGLAALLAPPIVNRVTMSGGMSTVILALHPRDALPLAQAESSGARLSIIVHGRREVEGGDMIALPRRGARAVEVISGARSERVGF